jgi:hypothetical protein
VSRVVVVGDYFTAVTTAGATAAVLEFSDVGVGCKLLPTCPSRYHHQRASALCLLPLSFVHCSPRPPSLPRPLALALALLSPPRRPRQRTPPPCPRRALASALRRPHAAPALLHLAATPAPPSCFHTSLPAPTQTPAAPLAPPPEPSEGLPRARTAATGRLRLPKRLGGLLRLPVQPLSAAPSPSAQAAATAGAPRSRDRAAIAAVARAASQHDLLDASCFLLWRAACCVRLL